MPALQESSAGCLSGSPAQLCRSLCLCRHCKDKTRHWTDTQHRKGSADVCGAGPQRQLSAGQHHSDLTGIMCSRGTGMDTETFMAACCILLRLSPTFVLNSLYLDGRHLQDRELSFCYLLPAITAQVSKTRKSICGCYIYIYIYTLYIYVIYIHVTYVFDLGHINFNSIILQDSWTLEMIT